MGVNTPTYNSGDFFAEDYNTTEASGPVNLLDLPNVARLFHGTTEISKLYAGGALIWALNAQNDELPPYTTFSYQTAARANDSLLRGISAYVHQYFQGGDISPANPEKVMFQQDVAFPVRLVETLTLNGKKYPFWEYVPGVGLGNRFSASIRADPELEDRWYALVSNGSGNGDAGLFITENYGGNWRKVQDMNWVPGGAYGGKWENSGTDGRGMFRNWRELIDYCPADPAKMVCVVPGYGIYRSWDRGENWTQVATANRNASGMQYVYYVKFHPTDSAWIYAATSTGLWVSSDGGTNWTKRFSGLGGSSPHLCGLQFHVSNNDELYVSVLQSGVYRCTNARPSGSNNLSFSLWRGYNACGGFKFHTADWDICYIFGVNKSTTGGDLGGRMQFTTNGGSNWAEVKTTADGYSDAQADVKIDLMGQDYADWVRRFNSPGTPTHDFQQQVLPHPTDPNIAYCASSAAIFVTYNKTTWEMQGLGVDSLASGETALNNFSWCKTNPLWMACSFFDQGTKRSEDGGISWYARSPGQPGGGWFNDADAYINLCNAINPVDPEVMAVCWGTYGAQGEVTTWNGSSWIGSTNTSDSSNANYTNHRQVWVGWDDDGQTLYASKRMSLNQGAGWTDYQNAPFVKNGGGGVFAQSPSNSKVLWAVDNNGTGIYRSDNGGRNYGGGGSSWRLVATLGFNVGNKAVNNIYPHPQDDLAFFAYSSSGGMRRYRWSGTANSPNVTNLGGAGQHQYPEQIRIDWFHPEVMWIFGARNGYSRVVVMSPDGGQTWIDKTGDISRCEAQRGCELGPDMTFWIFGTQGTTVIDRPYDDPSVLPSRFPLWVSLFHPVGIADGNYSVPDWSGGGGGDPDPDPPGEDDLPITVGNLVNYYGYDTGVYGNYGSTTKDPFTIGGEVIQMVTVQTSGRFRCQPLSGQIPGVSALRVTIPGYSGNPITANWEPSSGRYQTDLIPALGSYFPGLNGQTITLGVETL